jgi:hypothetical protein
LEVVGGYYVPHLRQSQGLELEVVGGSYVPGLLFLFFFHILVVARVAMGYLSL